VKHLVAFIGYQKTGFADLRQTQILCRELEKLYTWILEN
jgi:hypothetical protein